MKTCEDSCLLPKALLLLLLSSTLSAANPIQPQSTSLPHSKRSVVHHTISRPDRLKRQVLDDGSLLFNNETAEAEFERLSSKFGYHNNVFQQNFASGKVKRHSNLFKRSAISQPSSEPFDLAKHRKALAKRQNVATVSLSTEVQGGIDISYFTEELEIGTPAQTVKCDFDTGSADLWVLTEQATSSNTITGSGSGSPLGGGSGFGNASTLGHDLFVPSGSSTLQTSSTPFQITYGTGAVQGTVARDVVAVGGLSVPDQIFGVTTAVSSDFIDSPFDSLMGIGFSTISETEGNTWPENLVQDGKLASNLFSVALGRASSTVSASSREQIVSTAASGNIIFGAIDSDAMSSDIVYEPVSVQAYWEAPIDAFVVSGQAVSGTSVQTAFDTGTSLWYVPTSVLTALGQALGAQSTSPSSSGSRQRASAQYLALPCNQISSISLAVSFGGTDFAISGQDLNAGRVSSFSNYCVLTIVGSNIQDPNRNPLSIAGDAFLKNVVAVFDYSDGVRIGLASSKNAPAAANGTTAANRDTSSSASATATMSSILVACILALFTLL